MFLSLVMIEWVFEQLDNGSKAGLQLMIHVLVRPSCASGARGRPWLSARGSI